MSEKKSNLPDSDDTAPTRENRISMGEAIHAAANEFLIIGQGRVESISIEVTYYNGEYQGIDRNIGYEKFIQEGGTPGEDLG
jgi:hypothetical protein